MPKLIWRELMKRPRFLPLPIPKESEENDIKLEYQDYDSLKYTETSEIHRTSYKTKKTRNKDKKALDKQISRESKPENDLSIPISLWHGNNIRYNVKCDNCMKPRCIFAWRIKNENMGVRIKDLATILNDSYIYECGDRLFGEKENEVPHPKGLNIFHVRRNLQCNMPMERLYYTKNNVHIFPQVCSICGIGGDFVDNAILLTKTKGRSAYSMCQKCYNNNTEPITYGRSQVTKFARKRGGLYVKSNNVIVDKNQKNKFNDSITIHNDKNNVLVREELVKVRNILQQNNNTPIKKTNVLPVKSKNIKDYFPKNNKLHNVRNVVKMK